MKPLQFLSGLRRINRSTALKAAARTTVRPSWQSCAVFFFAATLLVGRAFPPAPHHLFYGLVRDEFGNPISVKNAEVILQGPSGVQIKTEIIPDLAPGQNYRLSVPMDAGLTQDNYKPTALRPTVPFKMYVRIGNVVYLPIEMSADYSKLGKPAESTLLNLTLGEDSDGDGLPDAWERALLTQRGGGTLKDINPGDDFDKDGLSNVQEYIAGTYAFDDKDGFSLKAVRSNGTLTVLEFLAVRGRTYTIQGSATLGNWKGINFRLAGNSSNPLSPQLQATDTRVLQVEVDLRANEKMQFFKLMVQ